MELVSAQLAQPNKEMWEWMMDGLKNQQNYFDQNVLRYPSTVYFVAGTKEKRIMYMPIQSVLMLESLAVDPKASNHEVAVALRTIFQNAQLLAQQAGIGEIYFLGTNERTNQFAERHGFQEVPWKAYKIPAKPVEEYYENLPVSNDRHPDGGDTPRG